VLLGKNKMFAGSEIDRKTNESLADLKRGFGAGKINFSGHQNDIGNTPAPKNFMDKLGGTEPIKFNAKEPLPEKNAGAEAEVSILFGALAPTAISIAESLGEHRSDKAEAEERIAFQRQELKPAIMPEKPQMSFFQRPQPTSPKRPSMGGGF